MLSLLLFSLLSAHATRLPAEELYTSRPLTPEHSFTEFIEGPAVDAKGNIFAVSYHHQSTIARVTPDGKAEIWLEMPNGSLANGIRFDKRGRMFVADYTNHNVLLIDPKTKAIKTFAHSDEMSQPNDLAMAPNGTLYASDPNWKAGTGQLWKIDRKGRIQRLARDMGTTNGIEVSPDGKHLYVNESVQRNVWVFDIARDGTIANKRLLIQFPDFGFDGMRADIDGNLYITRHGKGKVVVVTPAGKILREIDVLGFNPTNITFGGPDGRTCYVTEVEHGRLVEFRVERPGREWRGAAH